MVLLPFRLFGDPIAQVLDVAVDLLIGIYCAHLLPYGVYQSQGRHVRSHQNLGALTHVECVGNEDGRLDGISKSIVAGVRDDSHNRQPCVRYAGCGQDLGWTAFKVGQLDRVSDGIAVREVATAPASG